MMSVIKSVFVFAMLFCSSVAFAQSDAAKSEIGNKVTEITRKLAAVGKIRVRKINVDDRNKRVVVDMSEALSYVPMRPQTVKEIYDSVRTVFSKSQREYNFKVISNGISIEDMVPNFYRTKNYDRSRKFTREASSQLVRNMSKSFEITNGLQNRHIAMWQSHGLYYEQKLARWEWQRARIFETVEDLFTQSFVLPYLVPMLENAGANVLLPRERDFQTNEIIVDNDGSTGNSKYIVSDGKKSWETPVDSGFANTKSFYVEAENPFRLGSYQEVKTIDNGDEESTISWIPEIPETGYYAVYVSYKTLPHSTHNALYKVMHAGGETDFEVNQTMGGGTWIYLGKFKFEKGLNENYGVVLNNKSNSGNSVVTADAVKFGGGMGNIARRPNPEGLEPENTKSSEQKSEMQNVIPAVDYDYEISGYPRFTEGARYWMQWAGVPDSIYNRTEGMNDYTDDYSSRGNWVNYIAGGSSVLPKEEGLRVPVDLSFAFHSDAGTVLNDSIIGTLGIFMSKKEKHGNRNNERFENGVSRYSSRDLTDLIMTNIVNDVRKTFNDTTWTRRGMWNKSYSEARVPEVPTMLLELLSHQNFADMRYGLDPRFRFVVSRAVYKGMLKFVAEQNNYSYTVEPLPVQQFSAEFAKENEVELRWQPTEDSLEPSATPTKYIVYTRIDDGGFDNGAMIESPQCIVDIEPGKVFSFMITAVNDGGESFPSEILSVYKAPETERAVALIVNGFDRISAPVSYQADTTYGGFMDMLDHGVPDRYDINYIGCQYEFRRWIPWMDDDSPGFGASHADYEKSVIAGNSFDYPYAHGCALANAGLSFVSCSAKAVENGQVNLNKYSVIDLILGKQRQTKIGPGTDAPQFKAFPEKLQTAISDYCSRGGNIFVSGAFVATDIWDFGPIATRDTAFAQSVLHYKWRTDMASTDGKVSGVKSAFMPNCGKYDFACNLNKDIYTVESPDGIEPVGTNAQTIFRYGQNNISAGVAYKDEKYKTVVLGFPFETLNTKEQRSEMMQKIIDFFLN